MDVTVCHDGPAAIRDALIDEEQADFVTAYQRELRAAGDAFDLGPLFEVIESFRHIAEVTQHQGAEAHRRMLDRVAHALRTGEAPPGSISADEMRALIARRLADETRA